MDVRRVASIWRIMTSPQDIKTEDISNVFFDTLFELANMCYFNTPQSVIDHRIEEHDIELTLHDDDEVPLEGDGWGAVVWNL